MRKMGVFFLLYSLSIFANEPTMGMLQEIHSNTKQIFTIQNSRYRCDAYGVLEPAELLESEVMSGLCKEKIKTFYKANPYAKHFSDRKLYLFMTYHLEFVKEECLLFASGEVTLSELLLREGLAVLDPKLKDEEYTYLYKNAQKIARFERRGIWEEVRMEECLTPFFKEE